MTLLRYWCLEHARNLTLEWWKQAGDSPSVHAERLSPWNLDNRIHPDGTFVGVKKRRATAG